MFICVFYDMWGYDSENMELCFFFAYIFFLKLRKNMQIGAFADIYMAKK